MSNENATEKETNYDGMFGSLYLADCEFAIAAKHIEQVVRLPSNMINVPLSPPYVRGTFNLRGTVITVIDLAMLFGESDTESEHDKVAVLELNGHLIGVLFGRIGKVFRGSCAEFSEFAPETRGPYVSGVFRNSKSDDLVQVIDVEGLFQRSGVFRDISRDQENSNRIQVQDRGKAVRYMMFSLGKRKFGLPLTEVQEVFQIDSVTPSLLSSCPSCVGVTELRGSSLPLFDLMSLTGDQSEAMDASQYKDKNVVVMHSDAVLFGMLVDSVDDIFLAYKDEIVAFPPTDLIQMDTYIGSVARNSENILVFNGESLLAQDEIKEISNAHAKLSVSPLRLRSKADKPQPENLQTYLTFDAGFTYAVLLQEIQEIIDLPQGLLKPPGLDSRFLGVYNLRDTLNVAIAETKHSLHGDTDHCTENSTDHCPDDSTDHCTENSTDHCTDQIRKVLIFDAMNGKAGLVVDSVNSIVSRPSSERFKTEKSSRGPDAVKSEETLRVQDQSGETRLIPIVDVVSLLDHVL